MLTDQERESIRDFYGQQMEQMAAECIRRFLADKSIGYLALGDERGYLNVEQLEAITSTTEPSDVYRVSGLPNSIRIKKPDSYVVPQSIVESFKRHIWYSRYCLTDLHMVTFDVATCKTFALYIEGYVDDGWDNSFSGWEVYEYNGDLICSLIRWDDEWRSKEGLITHEDFGGAILPPPYTLELVEQSVSPIWIEAYGGFWVLPIWSEEEVSIIEY